METISIIICTLNAGKLLPDLFSSIQNQSIGTNNIEVIINDDDRTIDSTKDVISNWRNSLNIIYINRNKTLGGARLEGSKIANGKYLMHLDADMQLTKNLLADCIRFMEKENYDALYIKEEVIGEGFWTKCKWLEKRCYWYDTDISSPRFFLKDSYFKVGGHNPKLSLSEDKDIDIKFKERSMHMGWSSECILHNERRISIIKTFKNKFYWSQSGFEYLAERPVAAWKQVLFIFFRKAYFRNWKLLISHPILTIGMYLLKLSELAGAAIGGFGTKLGLLKKIDYKTRPKNNEQKSLM